MKSKNFGGILTTIGLLMIAGAVFLSAYNLWDERRAAAVSGAAMEALLLDLSREKAEGENTQPDYIVAPEMEMPKTAVGKYDYIGLLDIPALQVSLPVIDEWSYPALKAAPCRYAGSAYLDNLVIAAHNYKGHFGKIKSLQAGQQIFFTDVDGNQFDYEVVSMEVLKETAVEEMTSGEYDLTLFTCTYAGQSRVTIRCERINN